MKKGIKFAFVGAIGTAVNLALLYSLTTYLHVYYMYSDFDKFRLYRSSTCTVHVVKRDYSLQRHLGIYTTAIFSTSSLLMIGFTKL